MFKFIIFIVFILLLLDVSYSYANKGSLKGSLALSSEMYSGTLSSKSLYSKIKLNISKGLYILKINSITTLLNNNLKLQDSLELNRLLYTNIYNTLGISYLRDLVNGFSYKVGTSLGLLLKFKTVNIAEKLTYYINNVKVPYLANNFKIKLKEDLTKTIHLSVSTNYIVPFNNIYNFENHSKLILNKKLNTILNNLFLQYSIKVDYRRELILITSKHFNTFSVLSLGYSF